MGVTRRTRAASRGDVFTARWLAVFIGATLETWSFRGVSFMHRSTFIAFAGFVLAFNSGCGEKAKGGGDSTDERMGVVEVCGDAVTCGETCANDGDCPSGQHCSAAKVCYAECTPTSGCSGACGRDGRCGGQREVVVVPPAPPVLDEPVIVGGEEPEDGVDAGALEECATSRNAGQFTPVSMFVMFDNSISMSQNDKWGNATRAMNAFFRDPETAGFRIALRFFGANPVPGCDAEACTNDTVSACAEPQVPLGEPTSEPDDPHERALIDAVAAANPDFSGTPMFAALSGATEWGIARQQQNPDEQVVVVFVTDGIPQFQDCSEDIGEIAALAQTAYDGHGVLTYAIGIEGSSEAQMDQIARSGGTSEGIFVGAQNAERDLLAALSQIRGEIASCDLQMPRPTVGTVDPTRVNVSITSGVGDVTLGQVSDLDACGDLGAWYYDEPGAPSRILLCPAACEIVRSEAMSQIDIVLGCVTSRQPPQVSR